MEKNLEFNKLADIVTWADGIIRAGGYNEEKYKSDATTAYCHVKAHELWRIRDVALKSIERHTVYTNALNKDITDKAAKIDLLEKEIEGRKEGYYALKELMDTKYISIDEHNNICEEFKNKIVKLKKESEKWQDLAKMNRDTICDQYDVCEDFKNKIAELEKELADRNVKIRHQKENLDGINKTLEIRTKENESLIKVRNNLNKEIEAHESENARLTERIIGLKEEVKKRDKCIMEKNESINTGNEAIVNLRKQIGEHEEENKRLSEKIIKLHDTITELSHDIDNYKSWNASLHKDIKELKKENSYLKKELNETCTCKELVLKGHNRREMALVNELADKNDEIKSLKEENSYLKSEIKQKQNIIKKAYERYSDDIIKTRKDLMEVAYRDIEKDNGYVGFKLYVKSALIEAKGDKNEANEIITEAVRSAYTEWDKTQKENEKTIKKAIKEVMNKKYGYAGEIAFRIRSEVDKKRIVDIGEGAEKILGVSRELFDAAIKALADDGYQEIIGRIPQATNSYVYMDMHVLATPDVETKETVNAENIKSLDFDIPCGEDAIE